MKEISGMKVKKADFNWRQYIQGDEAGEDYDRYTVGINGIKEIIYHIPQGEGDAHYCDIENENGTVIRQFNPNSIEFI